MGGPCPASNLSKMLGCNESVVNVKAKTHEKVDSLAGACTRSDFSST